ncbi:hypothetical protein A4D02_18380 [Niastella koreensis]|uniref:Uncharacterized protein n=2 Tax=Niastella koreensis TaxID=354356 RepID=G8T965_NIAKG|nr:hypothetical protein [Niastella koreensis]AEV97018.1 hypothetical protein Niako_0633 [Niastella koreensis GR20-10]OQP39290.1 hypothetical protein A4D02_18380 [Niastella koreensis]
MMTATEANELVHQFENGTLPKVKWTHEAHFVMALWYCCRQPLPQAIESIKEGIKKYNISVGGENTDHSGYHETITVFYIRQIINYILETCSDGQFEEKLNGLWQREFLKKGFPLTYYSREFLMSKEARKNWLAPDLQPLKL